jgi:hypothetical protein
VAAESGATIGAGEARAEAAAPAADSGESTRPARLTGSAEEAGRPGAGDSSDSSDRTQPLASAADSEETQTWQSVTQVVLGANLGLATGAAPALQPALGVFVAVGLHGLSALQPWFQLEFAHAWLSGVSVAAGRADFVLDGGQALLCPIAWRRALFAAHGCGVVELARLQARGYDSYAPRTQSRAWASLGAGLLLRVLPVSRLELQLAAALLHPLWRDQFSFAPDVFYSVPSWRWQLKVGVAVHFL